MLRMGSHAIQGTVLVTGASSGIGRACALTLAARGFRVFAGVRRFESARDLEALAPGRITPVRLDVGSDPDIALAAEQVRQATLDAGLAGLVNCAGEGLPGPLEHVSRPAMIHLFEVNVAGQLAAIQAFLPLLRKASGRIVNVGSTSGRIPGVFNGAYCASKFALDALTSVLRAELASSRVKVAMIEPGVVATPFWQKTAAAEANLAENLSVDGLRLYGPVIERRRAALAKLMQTGGPVEDVCEAVFHALSSASPRRRYVVGRDARIKVALWRALPEWARDRIVRRGMRV
jgi:NAD(P)-dependent dehydrogenase (short-subunit alcohol dehydrogenase family)